MAMMNRNFEFGLFLGWREGNGIEAEYAEGFN